MYFDPTDHDTTERLQAIELKAVNAELIRQLARVAKNPNHTEENRKEAKRLMDLIQKGEL